jgi:hypothetical protein
MTRIELVALLRRASESVSDQKLSKEIKDALSAEDAAYRWASHRSGILRLDDPRVPQTVTLIVAPIPGGKFSWAIEHDSLGGFCSSADAAKEAALRSLGLR